MSAADLQAGLSSMLALSASVLLVYALRWPARRWLGARVAYALWWLPPLALLASLLPAPVRVIEIPSTSAFTGLVTTTLPALARQVAPSGVAVWLWLIGSVAFLTLLCLRQWACVRRLQPMTADATGAYRSSAICAPMVLGGWRARIVLPSDFEVRYTAEQRDWMLAHERCHVAAFDVHAHALAALLVCLAWWNPLAWWAWRSFRHDQELACDARVLDQRRHPSARRSYAHAMLNIQLAGQRAPTPLGCHWPAGHPLKERIRMLSHHLPNASSRRRGFLLVALLSLTFSLAVYAAQPAKLVSAEAPLYDVRLLLSRLGQSPVMPSLIVRGGERSGIRSDEVEIDLTVTAGNDGLLWIATDIQLDGKPAGEPTLALKSGEPGSISVKREDGKDFDLTFWVSPHRGATPKDGQSADTLADIHTPPRYPAQALRDGIEGKVIVNFQVDATGVVRDARIESAEPPAVFDEAALSAVRSWWLNPANHEGALPSWMQSPIHFKLGEDDAPPAS
ncbi:MAG: TonB family protein [Lysobacterales bacterium]